MNDFKFEESEWNTPNSYDPNFKPVPKAPGIYLLVSAKIQTKNVQYNVLYVGSSYNLNERYQGHEVIKKLEKEHEIIRFYFKECQDYSYQEIQLIKTIRPMYNIAHNCN